MCDLKNAQPGERFIDEKKINTWETTISICNIVDVEAGTNGYHGGDAGHGGRTYIRIEDDGGGDIEVKPTKNNKGVEFFICGDSELDTMIKALEFAAKVLRVQSSASGNGCV